MVLGRLGYERGEKDATEGKSHTLSRNEYLIGRLRRCRIIRMVSPPYSLGNVNGCKIVNMLPHYFPMRSCSFKFNMVGKRQRFDDVTEMAS